MDAIKKIDSLGRIVIPSEIRNTLGIQTNDMIEMTIIDGQLMLSKHQQNCQLCKSTEDLVRYKNFLVCKSCLEELHKINL